MNIDWLLGFIEAKGNFIISIQSKIIPRPKFTINCNKKFQDIMTSIHSFFEKKGIKPYRLKISHKKLYLEIKGIDRCIRLYNFLYPLKWHSTKRIQFKKWGYILKEIKKYKYLDKNDLEMINETYQTKIINYKNVSNINEEWILGFFEAKGIYFVEISITSDEMVRDMGYISNYLQLRPVFVINSKDFLILSKIKKYLHLEKKLTSYEIKKIGESYRFEIKGLRRCIKLYEFLDTLSWQGFKRKFNFELWGEILQQIQKGENLAIVSQLCKEINKEIII